MMVVVEVAEHGRAVKEHGFPSTLTAVAAKLSLWQEMKFSGLYGFGFGDGGVTWWLEMHVEVGMQIFYR